jgi:hypothetical protein
MSFSGCASHHRAAAAGSSLEPSDFRSTAPPEAGAAKPVALIEVTEAEASEGLISIEALVGDPVEAGAAKPEAPAPEPPTTSGTGAGAVEKIPDTAPEVAAAAPVVVDALVGQINGQPVYASAFLDPLGARLQVMAEEIPNEEAWRVKARELIKERLVDMVRDELVLAEAQAALTPEQKKGLLAFIDHIRENVVSSLGRGSSVAADESLREQSGLGLDAKVKDDLDRMLIREEIRRRVASKVNVTWRDVQLEYERNYDKYHPEATAHLRMIWLAADNQAAIDEVTRRLSAGEAFELVAKLDVNLYNRSEGGAAAMAFHGEISEAQLLGIPELNQVARTLEPGATSGPVQWSSSGGGRIGWIHMDRIDRPPGQSLYEVQQQIYLDLRERRLQEETRRYLLQLLDSGSYSSLDAMTTRLAIIAGDRYFGR